MLFNKQRYEFFSKSQHQSEPYLRTIRCCSISKDTNFSANHNVTRNVRSIGTVLFNKQRYEFFSKSQQAAQEANTSARCCSISKDTNFSANHNLHVRRLLSHMVLFNKQRYEFFSKSQHGQVLHWQQNGCCSISKDTNFSANHNTHGRPFSPRKDVLSFYCWDGVCLSLRRRGELINVHHPFAIASHGENSCREYS